MASQLEGKKDVGGGKEKKSRRGDKREKRSSVDKRDQLIRLTKIEWQPKTEDMRRQRLEDNKMTLN